MTADESGQEEPAAALRLAQVGDLAAFERLMRCYERRVFLIALRLLGNYEDAQDAAQEVFLRLHRHLGRMRADRDPGPWLYRVAVNVCRDLARARARVEALEETADPAGAHDEALGRKQRRRLVEKALGSLPAKQRAAVVLRDIEGLATPEVARALGCSEATVRSQVSAARLRIKAFVEGLLRRRV